MLGMQGESELNPGREASPPEAQLTAERREVLQCLRH